MSIAPIFLDHSHSSCKIDAWSWQPSPDTVGVIPQRTVRTGTLFGHYNIRHEAIRICAIVAPFGR